MCCVSHSRGVYGIIYLTLFDSCATTLTLQMLYVFKMVIAWLICIIIICNLSTELYQKQKFKLGRMWIQVKQFSHSSKLLQWSNKLKHMFCVTCRFLLVHAHFLHSLLSLAGKTHGPHYVYWLAANVGMCLDLSSDRKIVLSGWVRTDLHSPKSRGSLR